MDELDLLRKHGFRHDILDGLRAVRESGACNMYDMACVQRVADECGLDDLAAFMADLNRTGPSDRSAVYMAYLEAMGTWDREDREYKVLADDVTEGDADGNAYRYIPDLEDDDA